MLDFNSNILDIFWSKLTLYRRQSFIYADFFINFYAKEKFCLELKHSLKL